MVVRITILYFAKVKDILNKISDTYALENPFITTQEIFNIVKNLNVEKEIELNSILKTCLIAVNDEYLDSDSEFLLEENMEISILPPISAG